MKKENYIRGDEFHRPGQKAYDGEYGWAVNKNDAGMARVIYEPIHENLSCDGAKKGNGKGFAKWVFCEEHDLKENIFDTNLELVIDTLMEPNASVGLHFHAATEEIYYILEGKIAMTTVKKTGEEFTQELLPGDAHVVKLSQGHYGTAGENGVRFLTIAVRK